MSDTDFQVSAPTITAIIEPAQSSETSQTHSPGKAPESASTSARQIRTRQSEETIRLVAKKKLALPAKATAPELNNLKTIILSSLNYNIIYPPLARKHGWQGRVLVGFELSRERGITETRVINSSRVPVLDSAALRTLARISAIPEIRSQFPISSHYMELPVHYRLQES